MQIKLIDFKGIGRQDELMYAARLLQFTKNTRLEMSPEAFDKFMAAKYSQDEVFDELEYMASTIASSWEFADLTFAISNISRACAQQITRTRTASIAMQSQRVTDMSKATCYIPETVPPEKQTMYKLMLSASLSNYQVLVKEGISLEDARGVLPLNIHCNLVIKYNLRAWVDLVRSRDSLRVQGEYHQVIKAMRAEVIAVWPWVMMFLAPKQETAIKIIEDVASTLPQEQRAKLAKAADLLKKETA